MSIIDRILVHTSNELLRHSAACGPEFVAEFCQQHAMDMKTFISEIPEEEWTDLSELASLAYATWYALLEQFTEEMGQAKVEHSYIYYRRLSFLHYRHEDAFVLYIWLLPELIIDPLTHLIYDNYRLHYESVMHQTH